MFFFFFPLFFPSFEPFFYLVVFFSTCLRACILEWASVRARLIFRHCACIFLALLVVSCLLNACAEVIACPLRTHSCVDYCACFFAFVVSDMFFHVWLGENCGVNCWVVLYCSLHASLCVRFCAHRFACLLTCVVVRAFLFALCVHSCLRCYACFRACVVVRAL